MSTVSERSKKRKQAIDTLKDLVSNAEHTLIIHYSCESFYDNKDGKTPRITSIAIRYFKTAQTKSFSIQNVAERKSIEFSRVENEYDMLEKEMLKEFFTFVKSHKAFKWIHWNMRDIYFGFEALENRYTILGGKPTTIEDSNKFDLARILVDIYGLNYAGHPRFESLSDLNGITKRDFMGGSEEAAAFENKNFVLLHRSTLRKVDIMHMITEKTASGILKTKARIKDMYGLSPQGIFELMKDKWLFSVILTAINLLLGGIIGALVSKLF